MRLAVSIALVTACYRPQVAADVPCSPSGACPAGQMCVANFCVLDGTERPVDAADDAVIVVDAPPVIDARADAATPDAAADAMPDAAIMIDAAADAAKPMIAWQGTTTATVPQAGAASVTIARPTCATGDVMLAMVAMGNSGSAAMPTFLAPPGWTLVRRLDHDNDTTLLVYWHAAVALEPTTYTWGFSAMIEGVAWISCYANVDVNVPIDAESGDVDPSVGPAYSTPSITTTSANTMLVASFASHNTTGGINAWSPPAGTNVRANLNNGTTRSGLGVDELISAAGPTSVLTATVSVPEDYALVDLLALKPSP